VPLLCAAIGAGVADRLNGCRCQCLCASIGAGGADYASTVLVALTVPQGVQGTVDCAVTAMALLRQWRR